MENCLVSKLKGVVDNNNLERLGEFVLRNTSAVTYVSQIQFNTPMIVRNIVGHCQYEDGQEATSPFTYGMSAGDAYGFTPKYGITMIKEADGIADFEKYSALSELVSLQTGASGDFSVLSGNSFTKVALSGTTLKLYEGLANSKSSLTDLQLWNSQQRGVITMLQFAEFPNCTNVVAPNYTVIGTVEEYVNKIKTVKPQGSVTFINGSNGITYGDKTLNQIKTERGASGNPTVSWNGDTITISFG